MDITGMEKCSSNIPGRLPFWLFTFKVLDWSYIQDFLYRKFKFRQESHRQTIIWWFYNSIKFSFYVLGSPVYHRGFYLYFFFFFRNQISHTEHDFLLTVSNLQDGVHFYSCPFLFWNLWKCIIDALFKLCFKFFKMLKILINTQIPTGCYWPEPRTSSSWYASIPLPRIGIHSGAWFGRHPFAFWMDSTLIPLIFLLSCRHSFTSSIELSDLMWQVY